MSNRCEYVVKLGINLLIMNILSTETWISYVYKWIILKLTLCTTTALGNNL